MVDLGGGGSGYRRGPFRRGARERRAPANPLLVCDASAGAGPCIMWVRICASMFCLAPGMALGSQVGAGGGGGGGRAAAAEEPVLLVVVVPPPSAPLSSPAA